MKLNHNHIWPIAIAGHLRWYFRTICIPVMLARVRYCRTLTRLKSHRSGKLRVLFVTGTPSKWKCQSLYDLMDRSQGFEPTICQTICDIQNSTFNHAQRIAHLEKCSFFYTSRGMRYIEAYSRDRGRWTDLNDFGPDIVFYNQPWDVVQIQMPHHVAKSALTFQLPYYVANYGDLDFDICQPFQRTLFRYCALNKDWVDILWEGVSRIMFAGEMLPVGHTALDDYYLNRGKFERKGYVIYAPHWSIDCLGNENAENYSTFLKNGKMILAFAQKHPEIKWVFRPHPTLRTVLTNTGVWSRREIDDYFSAWGKIGLFSEGGGYEKLFMESSAMITDCGSFLTEYACTGNPIIHLISSTAKLKPMKPSADLYATYYQVHNAQELAKALDEIVLKQLDPNREVRLAKVREAGLLDNYAAQNIMDYLEKLLGGNE